MTIEQSIACMKRLQSFYQSAKLDEANVTAYVQEIQLLRFDDFCEGAKVIVRSSKFFPALSELIEATENACRKRLEAKDHVEREERLALQAGEDAIMDPKSEVHRVIQGPNHQRFVDMIEGRIVLPKPDWAEMRRQIQARKAPAAERGDAGGAL